MIQVRLYTLNLHSIHCLNHCFNFHFLNGVLYCMIRHLVLGILQLSQCSTQPLCSILGTLDQVEVDRFEEWDRLIGYQSLCKILTFNILLNI